MQKTIIMLSFLVLGATAYGQTTSGSIAGTVVDSSHAAIPNVQVTAIEQAQKITLTTRTDDAGRFVFTQIPPGSYTLSVEATGFKKYERAGITLNANDKLALGELVMEVGTLTERWKSRRRQCTCRRRAPSVPRRWLAPRWQNIAVNSRSYLDLVKLVPGVVSTVDLRTAGPGGLGSIAANGNRYNSNNLTINGFSNMDSGSNGRSNATVSLDSVQEFKILTGVYQAEFGRSMGAQITVVTKSGTSQFHGSGYWFHRNEVMNANSWLNNRIGVAAESLFRFNDPWIHHRRPGVHAEDHARTGTSCSSSGARNSSASCGPTATSR